MKNLLLTLLLFPSVSLFAQEAPAFPDMRSWMIDAGDTSQRYILADTAFIRIAPETKGKPADTLFAGDNITIKETTARKLTIRGLTGPWLRIDYNKNGQLHNGYIWQGLISFPPLRRGDTKFVYGIERRADSISVSGDTKDTTKRFLVSLKVIRNGKVVARTTLLTPDDESANFSNGKIMSGMGLTSVQNVLALEFTGEACAIPSYDYYFAWTKDDQLVRFPDKVNIADAGVFYHEETFTFPNEKNGKPDFITWNMITEEATDKLDKKGEIIMKTTEKKSKCYTWDPATQTISE